MSGLRELRKRLRAAETAEKTTFAMKLSAASPFRTARASIESQRPYALKTLEVLSDVAARAPLDGETHPPLAMRQPEKAWLVAEAD